MIDKLNIPIHNKQTNKIIYELYLDESLPYWSVFEFNSGGFQIYYEDNYNMLFMSVEKILLDFLVRTNN